VWLQCHSNARRRLARDTKSRGNPLPSCPLPRSVMKTSLYDGNCVSVRRSGSAEHDSEDQETKQAITNS
jgi:hypothetical protein